MDKNDSLRYYYNCDFNIYRYSDFDFSTLGNTLCDRPRGKRKKTVNECFIMLDTETSKSRADTYTEDKHGRKTYDENPNYIVKWSIGINIWGWNIAAIWGDDPWQCVDTLEKIHNAMSGNTTLVYVHNWQYDNIFLRRFLYKKFGKPVSQLATKPHYPISTEFECGLVIRDSLALAQRRLEKWGSDLKVKHAKAVGKWDYNKHRDQTDPLSDDELEYICNDVLCGIECLDTLRRSIKKTYAGMPYTATGIVRNEARKLSGGQKGHIRATRHYDTYDHYLRLEGVYHGGYTHANRNLVNHVIQDKIECYDFASSYPFVC